jgi:anaerobic glycerol-3-phosphate dehydrogenase
LTTLKEFEEALREQGMTMALAILEKLRQRDRATRTIRPARRIAGKKMTPELARRIIELNQATEMTQQEIAFQLGVNQGRVNEVLKRGKWLQDNPNSPEAITRDRAKARMKCAQEGGGRASRPKAVASPGEVPVRPKQRTRSSAQLSIEDFLNATAGARVQDQP